MDYLSAAFEQSRGSQVGTVGLHTLAFFQGKFKIDKRDDTFLYLPGWKKGVAFIGGFNLGRYWEVGPVKTLYVPAPILNLGENEIVIFELEGLQEPVVEFIDHPILG